MTTASPPPICTCGHTQGFHWGASCLATIVGTGPCPCHGWTAAPDVTPDPYSRGT